MLSLLTLIEYVFKTGDNLSGFHGRFKILTTTFPPLELPEIIKIHDLMAFYKWRKLLPHDRNLYLASKDR